MNSPADLLNAAIQSHQAGQYAEAEQLYLTILQTQPNHGRTLYLLGLAAHQQGNVDAAAQWYQRAIAVEPANVDAHNNLGVLMQQTGQLERAPTIRAYMATWGQFFSNSANLKQRSPITKPPSNSTPTWPPPTPIWAMP